MFQRAAILFGTYADSRHHKQPRRHTRNGARIVRATTGERQKTVRFLRDPHEQQIHTLATKLGLEVVGWIVTAVNTKKYGGAVVMSRSGGGTGRSIPEPLQERVWMSRFVTVLLEQSAEGHVRPKHPSVGLGCVPREGRSVCKGTMRECRAMLRDGNVAAVAMSWLTSHASLLSVNSSLCVRPPTAT